MHRRAERAAGASVPAFVDFAARLLVLGCLGAGCTFASPGGGQTGEGATIGDASGAPGESAGPGPVSSDAPTTAGGHDATSADGRSSTGQPDSGPSTSSTSTGPGASTSPVDASSSGSTGDTSPLPCDGQWWSADFSVDPTTLDVNGDGDADWAMRDGSAFPAGELGGGRWTSATSRPIDTRPLDDFTLRTLVDLRMRALTSGGNGAVFWVNMDYDVTFSPIWVSLVLEGGGGQTLRLHGKTDNATSVVLAQVDGLPEALVDVALDIDTSTGEVALWVDGDYEGSFGYLGFPIGRNDDRFATLIGWGATAEFDEISISQCP